MTEITRKKKTDNINSKPNSFGHSGGQSHPSMEPIVLPYPHTAHGNLVQRASATPKKSAQVSSPAQSDKTMPKTAWEDGIDKAIGNIKWDYWDTEIRKAVDEYNKHLSRSTPGYVPLDWKIIKAMMWVESGAGSPEWKIKPMQIGVHGDPGLEAFLSGKEGGDLILPPAWKGKLTMESARKSPVDNIWAGIGYLLMRMATYEFRSIPDPNSSEYQVRVNPGDNLYSIAKAQGSTIDMLRDLNRTIKNDTLHDGQLLMCRKASIQRVITGWQPLTATSIAKLYNGGGNRNYGKKIDYALSAVVKSEAQTIRVLLKIVRTDVWNNDKKTVNITTFQITNTGSGNDGVSARIGEWIEYEIVNGAWGKNDNFLAMRIVNRFFTRQKEFDTLFNDYNYHEIEIHIFYKHGEILGYFPEKEYRFIISSRRPY